MLNNKLGRVEMTSVCVTVTVSLEGFDIKGFIYINNRFGRVELTSISGTVTVSVEGLDIKAFKYILNIEL